MRCRLGMFHRTIMVGCMGSVTTKGDRRRNKEEEEEEEEEGGRILRLI